MEANDSTGSLLQVTLAVKFHIMLIVMNLHIMRNIFSLYTFCEQNMYHLNFQPFCTCAHLHGYATRMILWNPSIYKCFKAATHLAYIVCRV